MKRGFLNNTKMQATEKKSATVSLETSNKAAPGFEETALPDLKIYAFEAKYYHEKLPHPICTALTRQLVATKSTMHPNALVCTRIPPRSIDAYGTTSSILYFRTQRQLLQKPKYPSSPNPFDYSPDYSPYIIRDAGSKGKWMFATRALQTGDLILFERPLLIFPVNTDLSAVVDCPESIRSTMRKPNVMVVGLIEAMLEVAFARMSEEDKRSYLELANAHTEDGSPKHTGIWRTNVFGFEGLDDKGDQYGAIIKLMSRVNHSCRPNCITSFDKVSFSFELRATKPIAAGEEIVYAYRGIDAPTKVRQAQLKSYGFECTCASCLPETQNDARRTSLDPRLDSLITRSKPFEGDLQKEGLDGWQWQMEALHLKLTLSTALERLSSKDEAQRWEEVGKTCAYHSLRLVLAKRGSNYPEVVKLHNDGII